MNLIDDIKAHHAELTAWRRDIHAHPELGFEEHRTADFVAQKLREFGLRFTPVSAKPVWWRLTGRQYNAFSWFACRHGRAAYSRS